MWGNLNISIYGRLRVMEFDFISGLSNSHIKHILLVYHDFCHWYFNCDEFGLSPVWQFSWHTAIYDKTLECNRTDIDLQGPYPCTHNITCTNTYRFGLIWCDTFTTRSYLRGRLEYIWLFLHHAIFGNIKSHGIYLIRICPYVTIKYNTSSFTYLWAIIIGTVYPKKYAHGFVVLCFVVVMQSFIMNSHEVFIHIHKGCFAGTGAIVRLPQCQWSKPDGYGKISQCITTTKHSKTKTVCIFLGIYCSQRACEILFDSC